MAPRTRGRRGKAVEEETTNTAIHRMLPEHAVTQVATQRVSARLSSPVISASSPYRTRHRRTVRGPDVAVREGVEEDLVPPSDDEEYDEWRAVRSVFRSLRKEVQAGILSTTTTPQISPSISGPKAISKVKQHRFVALFEDLPSSLPISDDFSNDEVDNEDGSATGSSPLSKGKGKFNVGREIRFDVRVQSPIASALSSPTRYSGSPELDPKPVSSRDFSPAIGALPEIIQQYQETPSPSPSPSSRASPRLISSRSFHRTTSGPTFPLSLSLSSSTQHIAHSPDPKESQMNSEIHWPQTELIPFADTLTGDTRQASNGLSSRDHQPSIDRSSQLKKSIAAIPCPDSDSHRLHHTSHLNAPPTSTDLLSGAPDVIVPHVSAPSQIERSITVLAPVTTDPALLHFRSARTFRTRTALQLQPYTKERQLYETALRRGGVVAGRRAVAPITQVTEESIDEAAGDQGDGDSSDLSASPSEEDTAPDAIVIGNTPPSAVPRNPRTPKPIEDADYDEYFVRFGEVAEPGDIRVDSRLQKIAKERIRAEREAKRKARDADRVKRHFEALLREQAEGYNGGRDRDKKKRSTARHNTRHDEEKRGKKQIGGEPVTLQPRSRSRVEIRSVSSTKLPDINSGQPSQSVISLSSDSSNTNEAVHERPRRHVHKMPLRIMSLSPPLSPPRGSSSAEMNNSYQAPEFNVYDEKLFNSDTSNVIFDHSYNFYDSLDNHRLLDSYRDLDRLGSTTPRLEKRRRLSSSSGGSDVASKQRPTLLPDKRKRIARRMLPAAMLKRLEREAESRNAVHYNPRRSNVRQRSESPVRPGHAVIRRAEAISVDLNDMADLFNDSGDSNESDINLERLNGWSGYASAQAMEGETSSDDTPVVISSDSDSEAMEDNCAEESLARLHRGDFEGIVHGRTALQRMRQEGQVEVHSPRQKRASRVRRPALGLIRRARAALSAEPHGLVQTRLDFPLVAKEAEQRDKRTTVAQSAKKSRNKGKEKIRRQSGAPIRRPAIRLADHVIFTTADFAFDSDLESNQALPKRSLVKVVSKKEIRVGGAVSTTSATVQPMASTVDEGVGKARSWGNFDRFPIDFEISPLPSGVYCAPETIPGSGQLLQLLRAFKRGGRDVVPKPCLAYGVDLRPDISPHEVLTVLPILLDGVQSAILGFADAPTMTYNPDFKPLEFLRDHLLRSDVDHQAAVIAQILVWANKLDQINVSQSKRDQLLIDQLLLARWSVLELAFAANSADVASVASDVLRMLITYGFDRTVRPLKIILRGEADTAEITDVSVAVWVSVIHLLAAYDEQSGSVDTFSTAINEALDQRYSGEIGPLAAERVWFLIFGLCALSQFGADGTISTTFTPQPRWPLVKRALGLIKVAQSQETEEAAHVDQLQGRDRYIKTMVARCLRLSSTWCWHFDRSSFSIATRDIGMIFKDRQHRNLPTEPAVDFPEFISQFDISLTAAEDTKYASAFELYLRLACVAASDLISSAEALDEAHQAERDVQRLIMSIFPLSAVPFTRLFPPTPRQLGALINRYSTMVVACYFSPSLLSWLLANSLKWLTFDRADFESRQVCIRGLMYLAVACRHHGQALEPVVGRLADILASLAAELALADRPSNPPYFPTKIEIERTMVLVVTCFRQIIIHPGYAERSDPVYPDPCLLHECWTAPIFELDLAKDVISGVEIVATIQAFLDARTAALPARARRAREFRINESLDDYPSLGFEFDDVDLAALGGDEAPQDPIEVLDTKFAQIILNVICPKIYRLLSDMLPPIDKSSLLASNHSDRHNFITRLTKCWSDCAGVVVVEHRLMDWSSYVGPFGQQSWSRLGNELGRVQVGLHFMLNVAKLDPNAFKRLDEEFISLLFQTIVTDRLSVEHKYASTLFSMPGALDHALFEGLATAVPGIEELDRTSFMNRRGAVLQAIFSNVPALLRSKWTPAGMKTLIYRCVNLLVSALIACEKSINPERILHRESYHAFAMATVHDIRSLAGDFLTPLAVPGLKSFL